MLDGFGNALRAINSFKKRRMDFHEFAAWMRGSAGVGYYLDYDGDWANHLDNWLEYIEYCYLEEDWYDLGCSPGAFLEDAILNEPRPLKLPENDRVIQDQFLKK